MVEIDYTGNAGAALVPYNNVKLLYAGRPGIARAYQAGLLFQTTVRLTNVQTYAGADLVTDYRLAYDAAVTSLSSLTSITACAGDGSCLPATTFSATSSNGASFNTRTYSNGWNFGWPVMEWWQPIVGDFNRDGKGAFALANFTSLDIFFGNSDGTFSTGTYNSPPAFKFPPIVGDFNGDGRTDFAMRMNGRLTSGSAMTTGPSRQARTPYPTSTPLLNHGERAFGSAAFRLLSTARQSWVTATATAGRISPTRQGTRSMSSSATAMEHSRPVPPDLTDMTSACRPGRTGGRSSATSMATARWISPLPATCSTASSARATEH